MVLFEFILTTVPVFPRPSLIWESVLYLSKQFDVLGNIGILWGMIFTGMLATFFITYLLRVPLLKFFDRFPGIFKPFRIFLFFTPLGLLLFWAIYFPDNLYTELLLTVLVAFAIEFDEIAKALIQRNTAYELAAKGLGKTENEIYSKVVWKGILPALKEKVSPLHLKLWTFVLIMQFISGYSLGGLFRQLFEYKDFSGIYALAILIWIAVHLNEVFWYYVSGKVVFWEAD